MGTDYSPPSPTPNSQPPKKSNTGMYVGLGFLGVIYLLFVLTVIGPLLVDSPKRSSGGSVEAKASEGSNDERARFQPSPSGGSEEAKASEESDDERARLQPFPSGGSEQVEATVAPPPPKPKLPSRSDFYEADDIVEQYQANEIAADVSFKGKRVLVTGQIQSIGKDLLNTAYVTIGSRRIFNFEAFFDKDDELELAQLKRGQRVWLACNVTGLMLNVLGKRCRLQETQEEEKSEQQAVKELLPAEALELR
ncbi:MAG: OB-fold putative lipoprotein [Bryobacterales bacterium]|nr:OB-fold putative lipoprotein [Bryobacterales bacterium]